MKSISPNLNIMIKACEKASKIIIRDFGELENLQVSKKGPKDFVTNADKKVEQALIKELSKKKYSIISEEVGSIIKENNNDFWIIDPIDGTINFLHGIPHFCISLAFVSNNEIISGVIFDPIKNEMFYGEKNSGAFFNNQRIRVSKKNNMDDCLFASNLEGVKNIDINLRISGSAALDLAYVAAGRFDGCFLNNLSLCDIAAGIILVIESGRKIKNIELSITKNINFTAASNSINEKMLEKLNNF